MKLIPLADRVVIRPMNPESMSRGGIVIPDVAKDKPQEGEVIAVGNGRILNDGTVITLTVKEGDKVLYGKWTGNEITTKEGDKILIMREDDILAVVVNDKT